MKKFTLLLLAMLTFCFVQNVIAQVPYCTYDEATRTLTIGYADNLPEGANDISNSNKDGISIANYNYAGEMFRGCVKLVGGNGTKYIEFKKDGCYYAKIDGGIVESGYFTKKE